MIDPQYTAYAAAKAAQEKRDTRVVIAVSLALAALGTASLIFGWVPFGV